MNLLKLFKFIVFYFRTVGGLLGCNAGLVLMKNNFTTKKMRSKTRMSESTKTSKKGYFHSVALISRRFLRMWKLKKSSSVTVVLFIALLNLNMCSQGNARHYFIENSDKSRSKSDSDLNYKAEYHECYIMVQETRRVGGQCVKIRDNFHGCVAGSLMDPFHQDCL